MKPASSVLTLDAVHAGGGGLARGAGVRLFGRDRERGVLAELLERVPTRGGALVLGGEPGIGKSALLGEAVRSAAARGMLVLRTSGVRSEASLPFAGLHQLLRPVLGCAASLPLRQQAALGAAFGTAEETAPEPFLIALAALQLLSEAATQAPVVLAADDAQWLDRPTADVLAFIARRVDSDPVLLLATIRDGYPSPLLQAGLPGLHLEGLAAVPAGKLLDAAFPCLLPAARGRIIAEAEGNPLGLIELPSALAAAPARAGGRLPLTRRLEQVFAARAAELPAVTQTLLLVAAADEHSTLAQVMKAATVTGAKPTVSDLVPAVEAQLIDADDHTLRFRRSLVRWALYQAATVAERHAAHAALAEVLADDPDRQAWHRAAAATGPDPAVAAGLEEAARRARARGAISTAATAFERAADFTPDPVRRGAVLLSAAEAARELGHTDHLSRLLREADSYPLTARDRAYATWLGDAFGEEEELFGASVTVHALAESARQMAADNDIPLALKLLSAAALRCHWADLGAQAVSEVLNVADGIGASPDDPLMLYIQACAAPLSRGPAVLEHIARAVPSDDPEALYLLGTAASLAGDYHAASSLLGASATRLREQGRLRTLTQALAVRAWAAVMTSDFRTAQPAAEEAGRLAAETAQPLWQGIAWTAQAALAALQGDEQATDRLTAHVEQLVPPGCAAEPLSLVQYVRGLAALGQGQHADAWACLQRIYDPADPACSRRAQYRAVADLAEAAARTGHQDRARQILARFRPLRNQVPWLRAAIGYADVLLADDDHAEDAYTRALTSDLAVWPLARARLRLGYGEWLRRRRRPADSRTHLRAARDAFDALGAVSWSDRARRELRASGDSSRHRTPDTVDQLTPQELQIVQLAAEGLSNREIGQRLYLSHRTVEFHLYRVYPKLGITSRVQLPKILGEQPRPPHRVPGRDRHVRLPARRSAQDSVSPRKAVA
jgi:DNA-binding CsgD family transcriptional regulator